MRFSKTVAVGVDPIESANAPLGRCQSGGVERVGGVEEAVAGVRHHPAAGIVRRLLRHRPGVRLPLVREQPGEAQPRQRGHGTDEGHEVRPGLAPPGAPEAHVEFHANINRRVREGGGERLGPGERVHADRQAGAAGEVARSRHAQRPGDGVGEEDVVEPGGHERRGLARLRRGEAHGPRVLLALRNRHRLVRLHVRTQRHAVRAGARLHAVEVEHEAGLFHEERGRGQVVDQHRHEGRR